MHVIAVPTLAPISSLPFFPYSNLQFPAVNNDTLRSFPFLWLLWRGNGIYCGSVRPELDIELSQVKTIW
jgi:hypothetical protein